MARISYGSARCSQDLDVYQTRSLVHQRDQNMCDRQSGAFVIEMARLSGGFGAVEQGF